MSGETEYQAWVDELILDGVPIRCERCPVCGSMPQITVGPTQAFCGNNDCDALSWDMTKTKQDLTDNAVQTDISGFEIP